MNINVAYIVVFLVVIIVLFLIVTWIKQLVKNSNTKSPIIIEDPVDMHTYSSNEDNEIDDSKIKKATNGLQFTYSMWIYVANWEWKFNEWKSILQKGKITQDSPEIAAIGTTELVPAVAASTKVAPGLWFYKRTNSLHARITTNKDPNKTEGCDIPDFPLQKWVHVVYVLDNKNVKIYIDGALKRSCNLQGIPILNNDKLQIGEDGGYFGKMSRLQYFDKSIRLEDVLQLYKRGPHEKYKFDASYYKPNVDISINTSGTGSCGP
jgi:hypothetical protein